MAVFLACSFSPLHFEKFVAAHMQQRFSGRKIEIRTGLYGDLAGSIEAIPNARVESAAIVLEWPDLDPRLGIRNPTSWAPSDLQDIVNMAPVRLRGLAERIVAVAATVPVALVLPTLPLPPIAFSTSWEMSTFELRLRDTLHGFANRLAAEGVHILSGQYLDRIVPPGERWDPNSELRSGFPYQIPYAATLAEALTQLLYRPVSKKGIITDLDDTLWSGILGEVGEHGVSWDLYSKSQGHGLYQLVLRSLAETGVLIAVASKNDSGLVQKAFERKDLHLPAEMIHPFEVSWGPKSAAVSRILETWNVAADSVVFLDDSAIELAEVKMQHPAVECIQFPSNDAHGLVELLWRLRDLFGKQVVTADDRLRRESLRSNAIFSKGETHTSVAAKDLLRHAQAEIEISLCKDGSEPRPLELVNKTNQFNLNGERYTEGAWRSYLASPEHFVCVVSYRDKYSTLGKVAVLAGCKQPHRLQIDTWVMSCRAFGRQIEYYCLSNLFDRFNVDEICFRFTRTPRNAPLQDFVSTLLGSRPEQEFSLSRELFCRNCPELFQKEESVNG